MWVKIRKEVWTAKLSFDMYDHSIRSSFEDTMVWLGLKNGNFSSKSFYSSLASKQAKPFTHDIVWNSWVPMRVSFFASLLGKLHGLGFWLLISSKGGVRGSLIDATCVKRMKKRVIIFSSIARKHTIYGSWFLLCSMYNSDVLFN